MKGVRKIKYGQKASEELISSQEKENEQIVRHLSVSLSFSPSVCIYRNDGSVTWGTVRRQVFSDPEMTTVKS